MLCCKMQLERAGDNNTYRTKRRSCLHYHRCCWDVFVLQLFIVFLPLVLVPFSHAFTVNNSTTQVSDENEIDSNQIDNNLSTEFTTNTSSLQLKHAQNITEDNYIKIDVHNNKSSPEFDEAVESLMKKIFKSQSMISLALISDKHLTQHLFSTVYLGYSNNPFGSSKRYDPKIMKNVSVPIPTKPKTTPSSDIDLNTIPDAPDLKLAMEIESPLANKSETRDKRGVINLYNMVSCATGCNPLIYKGYGCYCGFLGSGFPVDGIDRCCEIHDWCYDRANCPMFLEYFVPYLWKCYHGRPICVSDDYDNWHSGTVCSRRLCECDRALSECLRRYECPRRRSVCTTSPWRLIQNTFMIF